MVVVVVTITIIIIIIIIIITKPDFNSECIELVFSHLDHYSLSFYPQEVGRSPIAMLGTQISTSLFMFIFCPVQS
jgi:hypothetical protein